MAYRDLNEYAENALQMAKDCGIPYGIITDFSVNTRAKSRWARTWKNGDIYRIEVSCDLLDDRNNEKGLYNTLLHEILHTCKGCLNHGAKWKEYAEIIRKEYGYEIKRASTYEEKGICEEVAKTRKEYRKNREKVKHIIRCKKCGHEFKRKRKSKFTENYTIYKCFCGGELEKIL